jgi:glutamate decarboxylase
MVLHTVKSTVETKNTDDHFVSSTVYGSRWATADIPKLEIPEAAMPANIAYKLIKDELALDGNPLLNLASFVTTYMEDEVQQLMAENLAKNFIDFDEYPQTAELHSRCVNMIARLFNAPLKPQHGVSHGNENEQSIGCSTIGSSEAIMLATLAMKRKWKQRQEGLGKSTLKPNLILCSSVQVCWKKAICFFEIDARYVYCSENNFTLDPHKAVELVDENTIGIVAVLGSTYTGHYDDIQLLDQLLCENFKKSGLFVPIHVDAASGGFVAPFTNPQLIWDFRLPTVVSINVSGHKYGLVYAGIGWCIWRSDEFLPKDLIFNINYLGADQATFTLNFSKSAAHVIAQYYVLIRYGRIGFRSIMNNLIHVTSRLSMSLVETGIFEILSPEAGEGLPVIAFRLKLNSEKKWNEFDLATKLREYGWIIPAYSMAAHVENIKMLRIVVREDFSMSRCEVLITDILKSAKSLDVIKKEYLPSEQIEETNHSEKLPKSLKIEKPPEKEPSRGSAKVC